MNVRYHAMNQSAELQQQQQGLNTWLQKYDRFHRWDNELAGQRTQLSQRISDREHLRQQQRRLTHVEQKLNVLTAITLTLAADEVASASTQYAEQCPPRQRLVMLYGQIVPQQKCLAQSMVTIQGVTLGQMQHSVILNETRQRHKEKTQQLTDVKTACEQEVRIKTLGAQCTQLQTGQLYPFCSSTSHPAVEAYQMLEPGVNQSRLLALRNETKELSEEDTAPRGQLGALAKQLQHDKSEAQSLRQDEQVLVR